MSVDPESKKLKVNPETMEMLKFLADEKFAVISVTGKIRSGIYNLNSGKSFFCNNVIL